ncbi:SDR family oxidoreductase [Pelagibacterales bacterium]|nr:SDR family oxidoreductase [Pelagibacterales bacterium]
MLKNKICVVTGASSNIGRGVAIELSKTAQHIYIIGRNVNALEETSDLISINSCEATIVPLDLTKFDLIDELGHSIYKKHQRIDVFVSCAGMIRHLSPVTSIKPKEFEEIINLNLIANYRLLRSFHPLFLASSKSRALIISKNINHTASQYWGAYNTTMSALNNLIRTYANENKQTNLKINLFEPPLLESNFLNITSPGENKKNLVELNKVVTRIISCLGENIIETGKMFSFS